MEKEKNKFNSNRKIIILVIIVIILIQIIIFYYLTNNPQWRYEQLKYKNTEYGFGFNPPYNWTEISGNNERTIVIFMAPDDDDYPENLNVSYDRLGVNETLKNYFYSLTDMYEINYDNYTEEMVTVSLKNCLVASYNVLFPYSQEEYNLKVE